MQLCLLHHGESIASPCLVLVPAFEVLYMVDAVQEYAMQQVAERRDDRVVGHGHGDEAAEKVWAAFRNGVVEVLGAFYYLKC